MGINAWKKNATSIVTGRATERFIFLEALLSAHPLRTFSLRASSPYFYAISGNTFGTVCNHRSLGKLSARVSRGGGRVGSDEVVATEGEGTCNK